MKYLRFIVLALSAQLAACDAVQFQALKAYMTVKKGLRAGDGAQLINTNAQNFEIVALLDDMEFPWGMDFLPDGRLLITEKPGRLRIFNIQTKASEMIDGVPEVYAKSQGGLLDVLVHPDFANTQWLYLSYSVELGDGKRTTRVTRYRLVNNSLTDAKPIFAAEPAFATTIHFGCALLFDNDGYLYITMGERKQRFLAQDLSKHMGKVLRLHDDGSVPKDNPFVNHADALPEIYSYGHRNPQGITIDRETGRIWVVEHGPQGGDEINLLKPGANYGWPIITFGEEYGGGKIGEGTHKEGMQQPLYYYVPSIATGGIAWYKGDALPGWQQSLFVAGLRSFSVSRVQMEGDNVTTEERLLADFKFRARDLLQGPDGLLYLLTENGGLLQLKPAST